MAITIGYSVGTDETFVACSLREAKRRHAAGDPIWLVINNERALELPASYNRCVAVEGTKINTAVMCNAEINAEGNAFPLPDEAPMLIFDLDHGRVDWLPDGIGQRVVNLHLEAR